MPETLEKNSELNNEAETNDIVIKKEVTEENSTLNKQSEAILTLANTLERLNVRDYIFLLNNPWKLFYYNFIAGTARGLGIMLGATFIVYLIYHLLINLVDVPVIGQYFVEMFKFVRIQMESKP